MPLYLLGFDNKTLIRYLNACVCVHLCVLGHLYAPWCISRLESGSRVLSSHELGLIFCLITPDRPEGVQRICTQLA